MASLSDSISYANAAALLSALADLRLVQSITSAMTRADIASGQPQPVVPIGPHPNRLGGRRLQDDVYEPRRHIQPAPVYEPRRHLKPSPYLEPCKAVCHCKPPEPQPLEPALPEGTPVSRFKIQPPWKTLPWENPLPAEPKPKVIVRMIDKSRRGQMIDLFI